MGITDWAPPQSDCNPSCWQRFLFPRGSTTIKKIWPQAEDHSVPAFGAVTTRGPPRESDSSGDHILNITVVSAVCYCRTTQNDAMQHQLLLLPLIRLSGPTSSATFWEKKFYHPTILPSDTNWPDQLLTWFCAVIHNGRAPLSHHSDLFRACL